jgi:hypothetical protein
MNRMNEACDETPARRVWRMRRRIAWVRPAIVAAPTVWR